MTVQRTSAQRSTDLVVVLPGIMGSTLLDAEGQLVWGLSVGTLMRTLASYGDTLRRLQLPAGLGDEHPGDGIKPARLMPDHGLPGVWTPVKGYDPLLKRLHRLGYTAGPCPHDPDAPPGNLLPVPYDWRLSNRFNGRYLAQQIEPALSRWRSQGGQYADAQVVLVCHSMGGLVARWYLEMCDGAQVTRKLITFGTPWRGAAKTVEQLVNGVRKGLGPLAINLTALARSLPSLHQLLPEYACITDGNGLRKTTETTLPELVTAMVKDAMRFHTDLQAAETARPAALTSTHMILGVRQPTCTTVSLSNDGRAELHETIDGDHAYGDATVPLPGAVGHDLTPDDNRLRRVVEQHGNLHRNPAALDELEEILTSKPVRWRNPGTVAARLRAPELVLAGEPLPVTVDLDEQARHALRITITDDNEHQVDQHQPRTRNGQAKITLNGLPAGAYTITATGTAPSSPVTPVSATVLVADPTPT